MKRVIVDASVLIAASMKDGRARDVLLNAAEVAFYAPAYLFEEVDDHLEEIADAAEVAVESVEALLKVARALIAVIPETVTTPFLEEAQRRAKEADAEGDEEYVALALALDAGIWTYDHDFDRIQGVRRLRTSEVEG